MFLSRPKVSRAISTFNHTSNSWAPIPLRDSHDPVGQRPPFSCSAETRAVVRKRTLSLTSWNIQASQPKPAARCELILDHILKGPSFPDIIHLQGVAKSARHSLLNDPRIRSSFLPVTTDAEDDTSFNLKGVPFATMTLLSRKRFTSPLLADEEEGDGEGEFKMALDSVFRTELPSRYNRDALCVNIASPASAQGTVLRLLNVHLFALDSQFRRLLQIEVLAGLLRESGCSGGVIAGVFNAISAEDHALVDKHDGLVDAWVALRGRKGGATI